MVRVSKMNSFVRLAIGGTPTCQGCAGDGLTFSYCVDGNKSSLTMSLLEHFTMTSSSFPPSQFRVPSLKAAEASGSVRLRMFTKQVKSMWEEERQVDKAQRKSQVEDAVPLPPRCPVSHLPVWGTLPGSWVLCFQCFFTPELLRGCSGLQEVPAQEPAPQSDAWWRGREPAPDLEDTLGAVMLQSSPQDWPSAGPPPLPGPMLPCSPHCT